MIKKRSSLVVGVAAAVSLLAAGCSGSASESDGPVTLTYWDFLDPSQDNPRSKALKENLADFEAANPDINIELSVVSLGDMLNRLPQAAAAGGNRACPQICCDAAYVFSWRSRLAHPVPMRPPWAILPMSRVP